MNFGDCPYCDDFTGFFKVPEKTPCYAKVKCESCGKEIWYRFSRIDPEAWTIEDFEKEFKIDEETRQVIELNPAPKIKPTQEQLREIENLMLYGDSLIEKPIGILNAYERRKR